ncbi:hypothetical protein P9A06_25730 [Serratia marcescens]|uniref:hypothetical protein n=1 Tax=Serratia marcescens TaxID=615 RepID=UPI0032046BDE
MAIDKEQQVQYYMIKGMLSEMPQEQQDRINDMKIRFKQIIEEGKEIAPVALSIALYEANEASEHPIGCDGARLTNHRFRV